MDLAALKPLELISSLYVHFPFCEAKCHYCDFYSLGRERTKASDPERFLKALRREAEQRATLLSPTLDTIFFGGGTPSMTTASEMARALEPIFEHSRIAQETDQETEWTMEANPSSITLQSMKEYRALGVNRVSMGVQALKPELLTSLGRVHSREKALQALGELFEAGFDNVSVDLLCGVPGQTLQDLESAMTALTRFPITHLSCYLLTLPKHHRMYPLLPNEDSQLEHLLFIDQFMTSAGFEHYEISNFAKPGKRARHNMNYWTGRSYLGLGPSAHSFDAREKKRWKNFSSLHQYTERLERGEAVIEWSETLAPEQQRLEQWMLALRLSEGFPTEWLDSPTRKRKAEVLREQGLIETHPMQSQRLRLTARGFALSDQVIAALC